MVQGSYSLLSSAVVLPQPVREAAHSVAGSFVSVRAGVSGWTAQVSECVEYSRRTIFVPKFLSNSFRTGRVKQQKDSLGGAEWPFGTYPSHLRFACEHGTTFQWRVR